MQKSEKEIDRLEKGWKERITVIRGDIKENKMGMKESEYEKWANRVDAIIHCASSVNWLLPYLDQRLPNGIF